MALKDIPHSFDIDSEEDLRFAVASYFRELGFDSDEFSFEDQFHIRLGHNTLLVEKSRVSAGPIKGGRSDLLLTRNGQPIAIVETKSPDHGLTEEDAWQAISYARLLRQIAPYAIITNGSETSVYDTLSHELTPIALPTDAKWAKSGKEIVSIDDDLKHEAARKLIGLNRQTLADFCKMQLIHGLEDLKGNQYEGKKYIPDLYTPREGVNTSFYEWFSSDLPCYALVGESGVGKTNLLCSIAEEVTEKHFVLFYSGMRLVDGLLTALRNDFVWEFHRERDIAYIIERFDQIAQEHHQLFLIFVDGIDEFPGDRDALKSELLDFAYRIRDRSIRLCLSCKAFDWAYFIIDKGQSYNHLAKTIFPQLVISESLQSPDPKKVGFWVPAFTDSELDNAFTKYKSAFSLHGDLSGSMRSECRFPLMLRFISEVYQDHEKNLPDEINSLDVFNLYWDRRLSEVRDRVAAEQILTELAKLSVEADQRQVLVDELSRNVQWTQTVSAAFQDLARLGFVSITRDHLGYERVSFGFEKIRSYAYTIKTCKWPLLKEPGNVAAQISALIDNHLGMEAVEFYLKIVDRGQTAVLTELAAIHFNHFLKIILSLDIDSSITVDLPKDKHQASLLKRLYQYADSYSKIIHTSFPDMCLRLEPYTNSEVGVWVWQNMYQFRIRTKACPEVVSVVSDEIASGLWNENAPPEVYEKLQPAGTQYIGLHDIDIKIPQKIAWERIHSQIGGLFTNHMLDESTSPALLAEQVWELLLFEPSMWLEGTPVRKRFWELLDLGSLESINPVAISDIKAKVRRLLDDFREKASSDDKSRHWYYIHARVLLRLFYWLDLLQPLCDKLMPPQISVSELFSYLHTESYDIVISSLDSLLQDIMKTYYSLANKNFSCFVDRFALCKYPDASILLEVSHNPFGGFHTDFLTLVYILLPTVKIPNKFLTYYSKAEDSSAHITAKQNTLRGISLIRPPIFGTGPFSRQIGNMYIDEPEAIFYMTEFSNRTPIRDQAYQLLRNEIGCILGDDTHWEHSSGGLLNDQLDQWIAMQYSKNTLLRSSRSIITLSS